MMNALIVDGDANARHALAERLQEAGVHSDLVADAREAIEWLRFAAGRYGIVLLDASAGTPGSAAFLTWLRVKHPQLTVLLLNNPAGSAAFEPVAGWFNTAPTWQKPLSDSSLHELGAWAREHFRRGGIAELSASSPQAA